MNFLESIKAFFTGPAPDPIASANPNLFIAASNAFDSAYASGQIYTTRANHRYNIRMAAKSPSSEYDEEIAGYSDPSDFAPYTEADLDAHTSTIDNISAAFDRLTAAFAAFPRTHYLYKSFAAIYEATTTLYVFATDAYSRAADCAMMTALGSSLQAAKDKVEAYFLELEAANADSTTPPAATAKAVAYKATVTQNAAASKRLETRAAAAQARAAALCANARSATDIAEEALEGGR